jgi:hypothetical protein
MLLLFLNVTVVGTNSDTSILNIYSSLEPHVQLRFGAIIEPVMECAALNIAGCDLAE